VSYEASQWTEQDRRGVEFPHRSRRRSGVPSIRASPDRLLFAFPNEDPVPAGQHPALAARRRRRGDLRPAFPAVPRQPVPSPRPARLALRSRDARAASREARPALRARGPAPRHGKGGEGFPL